LRDGAALGTRWLGVGLATALAVVTIGLWVTGRLALYINPDAAWWAVSMSIVCVIGAILSCAVPISRDGAHQHGYDHEHGHDGGATIPGRVDPSPTEVEDADTLPRRTPLALAVTGVGGVLASGLVVLAVVLPPASLSAELALARSSGAPPVLSTSATLALATSDDTSKFGIGEWASILATTTDPARFVGQKATLTGFVGPKTTGDGFALTRLIIVHCVIDAQAADVPVAEVAGAADYSPGQWVEVQGEFARDPGGSLVLQPSSVTAIDEPGDPYEY
jgi:uncharacterized repeat protein (TIGR03943 family)